MIIDRNHASKETLIKQLTESLIMLTEKSKRNPNATHGNLPIKLAIQDVKDQINSIRGENNFSIQSKETNKEEANRYAENTSAEDAETVKKDMKNMPNSIVTNPQDNAMFKNMYNVHKKYGNPLMERDYEVYHKIRGTINERPKNDTNSNLEFIQELLRIARDHKGLSSSKYKVTIAGEDEEIEILNLIFEYFKTFKSDDKVSIGVYLINKKDPDYDDNKKIYELFFKKSKITGGSRRRKTRRRKTRRRKTRRHRFTR